jgi:hypothetical protein
MLLNLGEVAGRGYELVQSVDNTWMIFEVEAGVPCVLGASALIGLDIAEAAALLRFLRGDVVERWPVRRLSPTIH